MTATHAGPLVPLTGPRRDVELTIEGKRLTGREFTTFLDACARLDQSLPTLCYLETLHPVNACRVCVVEVEGSRVLVPACSRPVEAGMKVRTDTPRVRHSRKMVLEFLASSVDLSTTPKVGDWLVEYGARPDRFGPPDRPGVEGDRDSRAPGHHEPPQPGVAATVAQPRKVDNDLYIRDYAKCILCYKCVEACGVDYQNTFAIAVAGRGFDARISTEFAVELPESACVYCGNCIAVCPTGALMFMTVRDHRDAGSCDERRRHITETVCPYCRSGVHPGAPRAGQRDRPRHFALRSLHHPGQSLHQGSLRVALRPESPRLTLP